MNNDSSTIYKNPPYFVFFYKDIPLIRFYEVSDYSNVQYKIYYSLPSDVNNLPLNTEIPDQYLAHLMLRASIDDNIEYKTFETKPTIDDVKDWIEDNVELFL